MKTMIVRHILVVIATLASQLPSETEAKTKSVRKVQEVDFDAMSLKGSIRNPDGAYLVQKRGLRFLSLHQVKKDMDARIRESSFYAK